MLTNLFMRMAAEWDGFTVTPRSFTATETGVLVEGRCTGTFKATGRAIDTQTAHVLQMKDGAITAFQQYVDTGQWQPGMAAR